jgi:glycosyltransferase involved in cell wall biosynthesis
MEVALVVLNNFVNDSRVLKESLSLSRNGYNCTVVALHDEGLQENEYYEKVRIHRVKLKSKNWSKNKLVQLLKYFEFLFRVVSQYKHISIMHCNDLDALPIGVLIKLFFNRKIKIVYDAHEYESERNGMSKLQRKLNFLLEYFLIKMADKVMTVSESIASAYSTSYNIVKPTLILNCPSYSEIGNNNVFRTKYNLPANTMIFIYQGGLVVGRGVEIILDAFKEIGDKNKVVVFMGYGNLVPVIKEAAKNNKNVFYHEAVAMNDIMMHTSSANFGFSLIQDICLSYRYCLPNKLFEYLMAGIPVVVSNLKDMADLVTEKSVGLTVENNKRALIELVDNLNFSDVEKYREKIKLAKREYCWENQEDKLLSIYSSLFNGFDL